MEVSDIGAALGPAVLLKGKCLDVANIVKHWEEVTELLTSARVLCRTAWAHGVLVSS